MKKTLFFVALGVAACGKDKDDDRQIQRPVPSPGAIPLLQDIPEASFWDYSVEKRCDGVKDYLAAFGKQRLDGSISNFNCREIGHGSESYAVAAELAFDQQKAPLAITITRTTTNVSLCTGGYKPDPVEMKCPTDVSTNSDNKLAAIKFELPAHFQRFTSVPQSKQLIYGLTPDEFHKVALIQLNSTDGVPVPYDGKDYRFFLKLTPSSETLAKGQVKIEKIEPAEGLQIFGCPDVECLSQKTFEYQIRQQWFTFASNGKLSAFVIAKPN